MSKLEAHPEVPPLSKENIGLIVKRTIENKKKANKVLWSTFIIYYIVAIVGLFIGFPLWAIFVIKTSPPMSPEVGITTVIISFVIVYQMSLLLTMLLGESAMKRAFKLNYEEWFSGECVLIVSYLANNDKNKAVSEVDTLASSVRRLLFDSRRNSRSKILSNELKCLQNGSKALKRMILFSTKDTGAMFSRFASAFIHEKDLETYQGINEIIAEAGLFGNMKGFIQSFFGSMEKYPTTATLIWAVVSTFVTIALAILGVTHVL